MAKKAPSRNTPSEAEPITRPRVRFTEAGPVLGGHQLGVMEGRVCLFGLPEGYRSFLRKHNGGTPEPAVFRWLHPADGERHSHVDRLLGFDPRPLDDIRRDVDCVQVALKYRGFLPVYSLPIGFVDRDDLLLTFEHGPRQGGVWIKVMSEVPAEVADDPDPGVGLHVVAPSFTAFLALLRSGA